MLAGLIPPSTGYRQRPHYPVAASKACSMPSLASHINHRRPTTVELRRKVRYVRLRITGNRTLHINRIGMNDIAEYASGVRAVNGSRAFVAPVTANIIDHLLGTQIRLLCEASIHPREMSLRCAGPVCRNDIPTSQIILSRQLRRLRSRPATAVMRG